MNQKTTSLSDKELYRKCKEYGLNARAWTRKFAGLLPEVYRRRLYKRKGCASIHEFAAKMAGMNESTVDKILNLAEKLKDKPKLLELLESGEVGWSKIEPVAFIANKETDELWADKVKTLPQQTLQEYVKEYRLKSTVDGDGEHQIEIPQATFKTFSFPTSLSLKSKLELFKQKLEKDKGQAFGWAEVMEEMLKQCEENEELKKVVAGKKVVKKEITMNICPECTRKKEDEREKNKEVTRYMPADPQKIIQERSGGICEYPQCYRPGEILHHTRRFAIKKNHDPDFIRFLCKAHEGILQMGLVENEDMEPRMWSVREEPEWWDLKNLVDGRVAQFRMEPTVVAK